MKDFMNMVEIDEVMTNFYHTIDEDVGKRLQEKPGKVYGQHSALNFCGLVWFENDKFHEQVWVYGSPVKDISSKTLEELMEEVNDEFGQG